MSLDLDAQVLISETAPVTSMIQRMGRCNRFAGEGGLPGEVYFYTPEKSRPYGDEDLRGSDAFVAALDGQAASQTRLQTLLEEFGPGEVEVSRYAAFVESGPWAMSREEPLRDIDEFTVEAILDSDADEYSRLRKEHKPHKPADGLIVPVPRKFAQTDTRVESWRRVAPASHYDPRWGFMKEANGKN
jgi:CRISPR-associated endonuclease/helicase Cas3